MSPVRELQGDEKRNLERRYYNWVKLAVFPLLKALSLPAERHFIKYGARVRLTEVITTEFIAKHTTIPVPRLQI